MPQIRPITDLHDTDQISALCHAHQEPVFFTKEGYGDLVVMSMETYEEMMETAAIDAAIFAAEANYALTGRRHNAEEALAALRKQHFGRV